MTKLVTNTRTHLLVRAELMCELIQRRVLVVFMDFVVTFSVDEQAA
jgi:hypothetical protein